MEVTFLEARVPLTKKFTASSKEPYPNAFEFRSHTYNVLDLAHFTTLMQQHAALGHCLLKGKLDRQLEWESRAGHTNPHELTLWVVHDLDGLNSISTVDAYMARNGMSDLSYILQWSASYGVNNATALRAHVIIKLAKPASPSALKLWMKQLNLTNHQSDLELTKTNVSLRWGVDVTTCQNDKLIYITPPQCDPPSLDQFTGQRIVLVTKKNDTFDFDSVPLMSAEQIKTLEEAEINRLRRAKNLPERKASQFKLRTYKGQDYMAHPDHATVTGIKEERGFVYLNLNGGDSWGYYHPTDNPTFIYNFKGEPDYKTSELLPDYWASLQTAKRQAAKSQTSNRLILAFRDLRTAEYYNGWYDQVSDELVLHSARSEKQLADFLTNYGQPVPDAVPIWNVIYDPNKPTIDLTNKVINTFKASPYMKAVTNNLAKPGPYSICERVMKSVFGDAMYDYWFNWLAYCFQHKNSPKTAWVAHGIPGTGKGILVAHILSPLFGQSNVAQRRMEEFEDKFNDYVENSLIVFVDEAQISDSGRNRMIMANIKNYITEPTVTVRRMRQSSYEVANRCGWIFASNMPDPVVVSSADRRFYVGEYQPNRFIITDSEIAAIQTELINLALALSQHQIDMDLVRTPVTNDAKRDMIMVSRSSADTVADAIIKGDLNILWDALPSVPENQLDMQTGMALQSYKPLIYDLVQTGRNKITREELFVIFNYNVGKVPSSPWKLTNYLKHHGIAIKDVKIDNKNVKGVTVNWVNDELWFAARRAEIEADVKKSPVLRSVPKSA